MTGVDRAEAIVKGQDEVRKDGPDEGEHQRMDRYCAERLADILQAQMAKFPLHHINRADEQHYPQNRRQMAEPAFQALSLARGHR